MGKWDKSCCDLWQLKSLNSKAELEPCCHLKPGGTCITHPQLGDMFSLPPSWPAGLAHQSSWKPAFGNVSFIRARQAQWHLERTAASRYTSNRLTQIKNFRWKMQPWLHCSTLQNCTCRQQRVKNPPNLEKERSPNQVMASPSLRFSGCCFIFLLSVLKITLQKPCELETKPVVWSKQFWRLFLILTTVTERFLFVLESK